VAQACGGGRQHRVRHLVQQGALVGEVPVQRGGLDAEFAGQPTHGQLLQPLGVEQPQGGAGGVVLVDGQAIRVLPRGVTFSCGVCFPMFWLDTLTS
jgi:hypothetical protein